MGALVNKPMTREEALKILNIEAEIDEELDHVHVLGRFDTLFEKNLPENGGSFYIQSKIYFAKLHLMMDFPEELNESKYNPESMAAEEAKQEEE